MKFLSRVVWSEGMHLGPQHFQTQSRYFEDSLWFLSQGLRRNPWGLNSLALDVEAVRNGNVVLLHASGIFPDGLIFDIPDSDPAPPVVSLKDLFTPTDSEITLLLSIPRRRVGGQDCELSGEVGGEANRGRNTSARYRSVERSITDETGGQEEYPVALGTKNLVLSTEAQLAPDTVAFPIARIARDGKGGFMVDPSFVPPSLRISTSEHLLQLVKRLTDVLEERIGTVSRGKRREGHFEAGSSALDVANHWLLHTLCSAIPPLRQHLHYKHGHPEELYLDLVRLAGALCTFSLESDPAQVPAYSHLHLSEVFHKLDEHIRRHLEIVVPANAVTLDFRRADAYISVADVVDERCLRRSRWIFGIRSTMPESELLRMAPQLVKICSAEGAMKLVQRALPGLELQHLPVPPAALPAQVDMHYFSIGTAGACWQHILQTKQVGVYVPGEIHNAVFDITVLLESNA